MTEFKMVHVKWLDANHPSGEWHEVIEDGDNNVPQLDCESCGFLVREGTDFIVIASAITSHDGEPSYTGEITIPRCAVKEIIDLVVVGTTI